MIAENIHFVEFVGGQQATGSLSITAVLELACSWCREQRYRLNSARHCMKRGSHAPIYAIPPLLSSESVTIANFNSTPNCASHRPHAPFAIVSTWLRPPCMNVSPPPSARCGPRNHPGAAEATPKAPPSRPLPFSWASPRAASHSRAKALLFSLPPPHTLLSVLLESPTRTLFFCLAHPRTTHARLACISQLTLLSRLTSRGLTNRILIALDYTVLFLIFNSSIL